MNAIGFPRQPLPPANGDPLYAAACAVHAVSHVRRAVEVMSDQIGAIYGQRRALTATEAATVATLRNCIIALSHASDLLDPLTKERPA